MVSVGMEKIACLLLCLSLLSDRGDCALSEQTLQPIMQEMFQRFDQPKLIQHIKTINQRKPADEPMATGQQYSFALHLSPNDCNDGKLGNNIPANFEDLRDTIAREEVYNNNGVVAALPVHHYQNGIKVYTDHSEYRVLTELGQTIEPGCLIVFTYFSPCFSKCLNDNSDNNIIELLKNLRRLNQNRDIVLVFSSLFHYDKNNNEKKVIYENLKEIPVQVYCYYEIDNSVTGALFDKNKDMNQHCLSEKTEPDENAVFKAIYSICGVL